MSLADELLADLDEIGDEADEENEAQVSGWRRILLRASIMYFYENPNVVYAIPRLGLSTCKYCIAYGWSHSV